MKLSKILSILVLSAFISTGVLASSQAITITVDGVPLYPDVAPQAINNRTMVPLRVIFEAMGAEVDWDNDTQTVTGTRAGNVIKLQVGNKKASINGQEFILDVPATAVNERTLVPVRFIAESLGSGVSWDSKTNTVIISDKSNDRKHFEFDKEKGEITKYTYTSNTPVNSIIPKTIDGVTVRSIGSKAFWDKKLSSVEIPETVTEIGDSAFSRNQLTEIKIPGGVTKIGDSVFSNNQLAKIKIPESVTSIGKAAFEYNNLVSLTIPKGLREIGEFAFTDNKLKSLIIPESLRSIGVAAFASNDLESLILAEGLNYIDDGVFYGNKLKSLTIPESVTNIGEQTFKNNQLTSVRFPKEIKSIGKGAFRSNNLSQVTISAWIKTIAVPRVDDPYQDEDAFDDNTLVIFKGYK